MKTLYPIRTADEITPHRLPAQLGQPTSHYGPSAAVSLHYAIAAGDWDTVRDIAADPHTPNHLRDRATNALNR